MSRLWLIYSEYIAKEWYRIMMIHVLIKKSRLITNCVSFIISVAPEEAGAQDLNSVPTDLEFLVTLLLLTVHAQLTNTSWGSCLNRHRIQHQRLAPSSLAVITWPLDGVGNTCRMPAMLSVPVTARLVHTTHSGHAKIDRWAPIEGSLPIVCQKITLGEVELCLHHAHDEL